MEHICTLGVDAAEFGEVAVCSGSVGTVGGLQVGLQGAGEFTQAVVGATKDILGAHALVVGAVAVEVIHKSLGQRVVEQMLTAAVALLQHRQLLSHLHAITRAPHRQPKDAQEQETIEGFFLHQPLKFLTELRACA